LSRQLKCFPILMWCRKGRFTALLLTTRVQFVISCLLRRLAAFKD